MAYLELSGINRRFGRHRAIKDISLAMTQGELVTVLGPSGSGKTTLLRMVAGLESPDAGCVLLDGKDITRLPPQRRNMGMVFQSYALFPNLTAFGNIAFGLRVRKWNRMAIAERVQELLDLIGLQDKAGRFPHQLSGGEQQRVALARALAPKPDVLLMDEPLSALDARTRLMLRQEIRRIQRRLGITTLFVTHDQEEALGISDRVIILNNGRIEQVGSPRQIYDSPETTFVANFVGSMNRLPAVVRDPAHGLLNMEGQELTVTTLPEDAQPGEPVQVWFRPERMRLADTTENLLTGVVEDMTFLGSSLVLHLRFGRQHCRMDLLHEPLWRLPPIGASLQVSLPKQIMVTLGKEARVDAGIMAAMPNSLGPQALAMSPPRLTVPTSPDLSAGE